MSWQQRSALIGTVMITAFSILAGVLVMRPHPVHIIPHETPTITGFSPTAGPLGTSVTLTGTNFTGVGYYAVVSST